MEIEVKVLEIGEDFKKYIYSNYNKKHEHLIEAYYLDKNDFLKKSNKLLRIRKNGMRWELTFKQRHPDKDFKLQEELETIVQDGQILISVFKQLGFEVVKKIEKRRICFSDGSIEIIFDKLLGDHAHIPEYLELEGSKEDIRKFLDKYNLSGVPWSMDEVIEHYSKL